MHGPLNVKGVQLSAAIRPLPPVVNKGNFMCNS